MQIAGQYNWGQDGRFEFKGEALQLLGSTFASRPLLQFSSPCMFDQLFLVQFLHFFLSTCLQHFLPLSAGLMYSASSVFHAFSRDPLLPPSTSTHFWPLSKCKISSIAVQVLKVACESNVAECLKFVKRTHGGGNVLELMMGKGGKQKWLSN